MVWFDSVPDRDSKLNHSVRWEALMVKRATFTENIIGSMAKFTGSIFLYKTSQHVCFFLTCSVVETPFLARAGSVEKRRLWLHGAPGKLGNEIVIIVTAKKCGPQSQSWSRSRHLD